MKSAAIPSVGGRGAAVSVQDVPQVAVPAADNVDTTTIAFGQAEPGRDIFADKAADPKSPARADTEEAVEPKAIHTNEAQLSEQAIDTEAKEKSASEEKYESEPQTNTTPAEKDEAEAERARKELFPEEEYV